MPISMPDSCLRRYGKDAMEEIFDAFKRGYDTEGAAGGWSKIESGKRKMEIYAHRLDRDGDGEIDYTVVVQQKWNPPTPFNDQVISLYRGELGVEEEPVAVLKKIQDCRPAAYLDQRDGLVELIRVIGAIRATASISLAIDIYERSFWGWAGCQASLVETIDRGDAVE